jgi:zinc protease
MTFFRLLAVVAALWATSAQAEPHVFKLDNGLTGVVISDNRAPVVVHMAWYKAGGIDEVSSKTGIAHMLEHMMFKGTPSVPAGQFSRIIARKGGQDNAFTSSDSTAYFQKIARENVDIAVKMEADRMANLSLTDELFQPEHDVVQEERRLRVDNVPQSRFFEQAMKQHMPTHPYGNPVIGWKADIDGYTLADAVAWYNRYYGPNNCVVVLAGDLTAAEGERLIRTYYGPLKSRTIDRPALTAEPVRAKAQRFVHEDAQAQIPLLYRAYRTPSLFGGIAGKAVPKADVMPLVVLANVLGGGSTGRLYQELVVRQKIADDAGTGYDPAMRSETTFDVYAQPKPGIGLEKLEKALDGVLKNLAKSPVTDDELARAKVTLKASNVYAQDSAYLQAFRWGRWLTIGGTVDTFDDWKKDLDAVSLDDLARVAKAYLVPAGSTTAILKPAKGS